MVWGLVEDTRCGLLMPSSMELKLQLFSLALYTVKPSYFMDMVEMHFLHLTEADFFFFNLLHPRIADLILYLCLYYQTTLHKLSRARLPSRGCSCFIWAPGSINSYICLLCVAETVFVINSPIILREGEGSPALVYGRLCTILVNSFGFGRRHT